MQISGNLPGISKGDLAYVGLDYNALTSRQSVDYRAPVIYPLGLTWYCAPYRQYYDVLGQLHTTWDNSTYHYLIEKKTRTSWWRLVRACRKSDGKLEDLAIQ
jgi:hypothetical protein